MLTAAFCTYNRADRLPALVAALRAQSCPVPFEILAVDNNSRDDTQRVLGELATQDGVPLRFVREQRQGIPYARNRAIEESLDSDYLVFVDDDEIPAPGLLTAAVDALEREGAECAGGRVAIVFPGGRRPQWLTDELLGFLAEIDHGDRPFWITDRATPLWTANIAYRMALFADDPGLRFDHRYNRNKQGVGGGSDAMMFRAFLERGIRMRYRPDMVVEHHVEEWRLTRSYFLKLHFEAGRKYGEYESGDYPKTVFGVPPFMVRQTLTHALTTAHMTVRREPGALRQGMNAAHALGCIWGRLRRRADGSAERG